MRDHREHVSSAHARRHGALWIVVVALMVFLAGVVATLAMQNAADAKEREHLLGLARTAVASVSLADVQSLRGTPEDIGTPQHEAVRRALSRVREANQDVRFVYLMGNRGGDKMFFFADSEPESSPDYSAPGDVYEDTTLAELEGFRTSRGFVEGPSADDWGEWVSAMAPVVDPNTGGAVALLGMDISTETFNARVREATALPMAITASVLGALVTYWLYVRRRHIDAEEIAQEREMLRVVLEDMPSGVVVARYPSGEVVFENPQAWSIAERQGKAAHVRDYHFVDAQGHPYPANSVPAAITLATGQRAMRDDLHVLRPGGHIRIRAESTPVRDWHGRVRYVVMVLS